MGIKSVSVGAFVPADGAIVTDGEAVTVSDQGTGSASAELAVSGGAVTGAELTSATAAIAQNSQNTVVRNSTEALSASGALVVAAGAITQVSVTPTSTLVGNGFALTGVTPSGAYTDTVTFTVAGGVITAIVLS